MTRNWKAFVAVALLVASGVMGSVAACGSDSPRRSSAQSDPAEARHTYLKAVDPVNQAVAVFTAATLTWDQSNVANRAVPDAQPLIGALAALQESLLGETWPETSQRDLEAVVSGIAPLKGDLESLKNPSVALEATWLARLQSHVTALNTATSLVRRSLGLPPGPNN